jgi:hypothetical protein
MGHWYTKDGRPCHKVPKKTGEGERDTTVADARKMGLVPSVTGIIDLIDKPGLVKWSAELMLDAVGYTLNQALFDPKSIKTEGDADAVIWGRWGELRIEARDRGSVVHAMIEDALRGQEPDPKADYAESVTAAVSNILKHTGSLDGEIEQTHASVFGFGGTVDYHDPKRKWIVDHKSKAFTKDDRYPPRLWDSHYMQLAAYRKLVGGDENTRCAINYVSTSEPGLTLWLEASEEYGWKLFLALFEVWKITKNYDPSEA